VFGIVNILGFNSPEWFIANNGSILAGAIAAGIYATNLPDACKYITEHSKAQLIVLEGNKQLAKYKDSAASLKHVKAIVVYGGEAIDPTLKSKLEKAGKKVVSWEDFMASGDAKFDLETRQRKVRPGNCSTLIYTSGTTGNPKAVMISHDNATWTAKNMVQNYLPIGPDDRLLSYLPLSHIAAQIMDIHAPLCTGACVYFAQPDVLKGTLTDSLKDMRPTVFFGVPRVWEKVNEGLAKIGRTVTGLKKVVSGFAKGMAAEKNKNAQFGGSQSTPLLWCIGSSVTKTIKAAIGLDQCRACFTAAAPIAPETINYFSSLDIPVYEVFGQSECTGPHTISNADQWIVGYCGRPMLGTESMLVKDNGELCYRGRHIFMGYMYMPDKTKETIDSDGWLHSGDVAEFDSNNIGGDMKGPSGFMKITGRIKELIITAGGENIPPVLIENEMKAAMLAISNVMVIGDRRKYLSMLVCLKCEPDKTTGRPTDILAADSLFVGGQIGSDAKTLSEATVDPLWIKYINDGIKVANKKTTSNAQVVQKYKMLPVDFSEQDGDLTPTMKLKRNVVSEKYADLIDSIYDDSKV
jgi:long-chain-fatty-acid--CoA ligase ACSBG